MACAMPRSENVASVVKNDKQTTQNTANTAHARAHKNQKWNWSSQYPARSIRKHSIPTPTRVSQGSCERRSIDHWGFFSKARKPGLIEFRASKSRYLKQSVHYVCFLEDRRIVSAATIGTKQENAPPASGQTQAIRC